MPAKSRFAIVAIVGMGLTALRAQESVPFPAPPAGNDLPVAYPEERYLPGWKKSPFMREAAPAPAQAQKSFSRDYFLAGYVESADETIVYLKNQKTGESIRLTTKGGNPAFKLLTLRKDRDPGKVFATVEHGSEKADIGYAPAAIAQPASPGQTVPAPAAGAVANTSPNPAGSAPATTANTDPADQATGPYLNPASERLRQQQTQATTTPDGKQPTPLGRKRRTLPEPLKVEGEN